MCPLKLVSRQSVPREIAPCPLLSLLLGLSACLALAACTKDMATQERLTPQNHIAPLAPVGTVANPELKDTGEFRSELAAQTPLVSESQGEPVTLSLLKHGEERYAIHCAPCHNQAGEGLGVVVLRGFQRPRALFEPSVRARSDEELLRLISDGYQSMAGMKAEMSEGDRRAVVAFVRALQLSRAMPAAHLSPEDRAALKKTETPK